MGVDDEAAWALGAGFKEADARTSVRTNDALRRPASQGLAG
jgi:hypothetical protein